MDRSDYSELCSAIMENYICHTCGTHYKKQDDSANCPSCELSRKEQATIVRSQGDLNGV